VNGQGTPLIHSSSRTLPLIGPPHKRPYMMCPILNRSETQSSTPRDHHHLHSSSLAGGYSASARPPLGRSLTTPRGPSWSARQEARCLPVVPRLSHPHTTGGPHSVLPLRGSPGLPTPSPRVLAPPRWTQSSPRFPRSIGRSQFSSTSFRCSTASHALSRGRAHQKAASQEPRKAGQNLHSSPPNGCGSGGSASLPHSLR